MRCLLHGRRADPLLPKIAVICMAFITLSERAVNASHPLCVCVCVCERELASVYMGVFLRSSEKVGVKQRAASGRVDFMTGRPFRTAVHVAVCG